MVKRRGLGRFLLVGAVPILAVTLPPEPRETEPPPKYAYVSVSKFVDWLGAQQDRELATAPWYRDRALAVFGAERADPAALREVVAWCLRGQWTTALTGQEMLAPWPVTVRELQEVRALLDPAKDPRRQDAERAVADLEPFVADRHVREAKDLLAISRPFSNDDYWGLDRGGRALGRLVLSEIGSEGRAALTAGLRKYAATGDLHFKYLFNSPYERLSASTQEALDELCLVRLASEMWDEQELDAYLSTLKPEEREREQRDYDRLRCARAAFQTHAARALLIYCTSGQVLAEVVVAPGERTHWTLSMHDLRSREDLRTEPSNEELWGSPPAEGTLPETLEPGVVSWEGDNPRVTLRVHYTRLREFLADLAATLKVTVVAEAYPETPDVNLNAQDEPVRDVLQSVAEPIRVQISRQGDIIRVRSVDWTAHAAVLVPPDLLNGLLNRKFTAPGQRLPIEDLVTLAGLGEFQLDRAGAFGWRRVSLGRDVAVVTQLGFLLRTLPSLSSKQRKAMFKGEPVEVKTLPAAVRDDIMGYLMARAYGVLHPMENLSVRLLVTDGGLSGYELKFREAGEEYSVGFHW